MAALSGEDAKLKRKAITFGLKYQDLRISF
jgi:hypothetical protein